MRYLQVSKVAEKFSAPQPLSRSLLLDLINEPALELLSQSSRITQSARTFNIVGDAQVDISLKRSKLYEGMFELPPGTAMVPGIPGLSGERLTTRCTEPSGRSQKVVRGDFAESWVPKTESVTYHPIPIFKTPGVGILKSYYKDRVRYSQPDDEDITIFGDDNRINIYPSGYPERCVCRIEVYTQDVPGGAWIFKKRGTGFMAGERVMLTSGHMHPPEPYAGWMIKVVPGYYNGTSVYGASFFTYASDYRYWYSDAGNDLMACRLYDAIGQTTGYFGAINYNSDWEDRDVWALCGYPFDRGEQQPTFQAGIPVRDDDDGDDIKLPDGNEYDTTQIENEADRARGASGSPLYSWFDNGQMYAIGVHHGLEVDYIFPFSSEKFSAASGGSGFVELVKWARANWP